jgi:DNA invertase Pin-like site-specific DNA recombinase
VGRFDSRRCWTVLPLIPFTTLHNRRLRISAFCGELQKTEFEGNVIRKRTLAGLKAARAHGRVGGRPEKLSVRDKQQIRAAVQRPRSSRQDVARRFGVSVGTVYKQVGAVAAEK